MTLTDTQLVLLSAASQREDGGIELARNLKGGAAHRVVGKLLSQGLIEEIPACPSRCASLSGALPPPGSRTAPWPRTPATASKRPMSCLTSAPAGSLHLATRGRGPSGRS
jgi:hypothetical protein